MPAPLITTFKDTGGKEHDLKLTWGTAMRLKDASVIDVFSLFRDGQKNFVALMSDPIKVIQVVAAILNIDQAQFSDFASKIDGRVGRDMAIALQRAVGDFFPDLAQTLEASLVRAMSVQQATETEAVAEINKIDPVAVAKKAVASMGARIDQMMDSLDGSSSEQAVASGSGSIQPDTMSPSASP